MTDILQNKSFLLTEKSSIFYSIQWKARLQHFASDPTTWQAVKKLHPKQNEVLQPLLTPDGWWRVYTV